MELHIWTWKVEPLFASESESPNERNREVKESPRKPTAQ